MPRGALIAIADLIDCVPTNSLTVGALDTPRSPDEKDIKLYVWTERQMGDFTPGRFGWILANVRRFAEPIPFAGHQGLFNVSDEIIAAALEASKVVAA